MDTEVVEAADEGSGGSRHVRELGHRWPVGLGAVLLVAPIAFVASTHVWLSSGSVRAATSLVVGIPSALVVMMLPGVAGLILLPRADRGGMALAVSTVVTLSGIVAWAVLWVWIAAPAAGRVVSWVVYLVAVAIVVAGARAHVRMLLVVALVLAVGAAATLVVDGMFYVHGGLPVATQIAANGTFGSADNTFPRDWVERIEHRQDLRVPDTGWPLADRPPVQAAWILPLYSAATQSSHGNHEVAYELTTSALQGLAAGVALVLLVLLGLRRRRLMAAIAMVTLTVFFEFNTAYTWPKLLPAALLLFAVAALLEPLSWPGPPADATAPRPVVSPLAWSVAGGAVGLSLRAHPGSAFSLPILAVVLVALWHRRVDLGRPLLAIAAMTAVAAPWGAYRLFYDHSSSPLLKLHLAGVANIHDRRSVLHATIDAYRALHVRGWLRHRLDNLRDLVWRPSRTSLPPGLRDALTKLGGYSPLWSGDLLLFAAPLLALRRVPRNVRLYALAGAVTILAWTVVEFGPPNADAITHQGPYAAFLLLDIALAAAVAFALGRRA
ncbi:MAG TPA: hypothetical protein VMT43_02825, partial [Acidimicrobiales bacterium]|nr:hypothetical protein [Acidimicrobiales bacterium]